MSKMKEAKQRVAIAKDVILQLRSNRLRAKHGEYVRFDERVDLKEGEQLSKVLKKVDSCQVCAKGAAFIAAVDRFNKLEIERHMAQNNASGVYSEDFLHQWFSPNQLNEIEAAFEGWGKTAVGTYFGYARLPMKKKMADIRLSMIMQNIVRNDGTFVPEQFIERMKTKGYYKRV